MLRSELVAAAEEGVESTRAAVSNLQQQLEVTSQALDASQKLVAAAASQKQFFLSRITALRRQL